MLGIPFIDQAIFKVFKPRTTGDWVDRLCSHLTTTICAVFAIMVSTKQYVGTPITCWNPAEFTGHWSSYAREYCFIQNTYAVSFAEHGVPKPHLREASTINYYQWVPIILVLQAMGFYLPNHLWKCFNKFNGFDVSVMVEDAHKVRSHTEHKRESTTKHISQIFIESIKERRTHEKSGRINGLSSNSLTSLYLSVKFFYLVNAIVQFYLVTKLLDAHNDLWAIRTITSFWSGDSWTDSPSFPRVTMCDFAVKDHADTRVWTVQCLLMLNIINEKIFLFQWFWFGVVTVLCTFSTGMWIRRVSSFSYRISTIRGWLSYPNTESVTEEMALRFVNRITMDGYMTLQFINENAGSRVTSEIAQSILHSLKEIGAMNHPNRATAPNEELIENGHYPTLPVREEKMDCFD